MKRADVPLLTFVESRVFTATASAAGITDSILQRLEKVLLANPEAGVRVGGTGGARKIRVAPSDRGKRGGSRVLYYYAVRREAIHLLIAYPKNVQEDLTSEQKKQIRSYIARLEQS